MPNLIKHSFSRMFLPASPNPGLGQGGGSWWRRQPNWWVAGEAKAEASDVMDLQRMKRPGLELGKQRKQGQV